MRPHGVGYNEKDDENLELGFAKTDGGRPAGVAGAGAAKDLQESHAQDSRSELIDKQKFAEKLE